MRPSRRATASLHLLAEYQHRISGDHPVEGIGAGGYVVVGLAALLSGGAFLANLFGRGVSGTLASGGSIPVLNWASAIAVTLAMLLLFSEFLETYDEPFAPEDIGR